ncbi:hypothetical protein BDZ89DRAFT_1062690 [Hymenopellis radicata]|nr:hypothetical protein BDZ89DRAFT_1062690 [Hymenopellis radicata]
MASLATNSFPPRSMSMDEAVEQGFFFVKVQLENADAIAERPRERDELFAAIQTLKGQQENGPSNLREVDPDAAGTDSMLQVQAALVWYDAYLRTTEATTINGYMCHCFYAFTASIIFTENYVEWESEAAYLAYFSRLRELASDWVDNHRSNPSNRVPPAQALAQDLLDIHTQRVIGPKHAAVLMPAPYRFLTLKFRHPSLGNWRVTAIKTEGSPVYTLSCNSTSMALEVDEDDLFDVLSESETIDNDGGREDL